MVVEFLFVLLVDLSDLLVQEYVSVHGLFARSLHYLMELGCDSLVSGLSFMCFAKSLSDLSGEPLLDFLRLHVQKLNLLVDSGEFSTNYLDPAFNSFLTVTSSWAINNRSGGRELKARCGLSWLTVGFWTNRPRICSNLRNRKVMRDSLIGSGVRGPCLGASTYFDRKASPTGDRGVRAECARAWWVTVDTTLGAAGVDSSSPPSSLSSWPACHSITSGALRSEDIL